MISLNSKPTTDSDLRIAIALDAELTDADRKANPPWFLFTYNQKQRLESAVENAKNVFNLNAETQYSLVMAPDKSERRKNYRFVTEENRHEITNGIVLYIYYSPSVLVKNLITKVNSPGFIERQSVLEKILDHSYDPVFVEEFHKQNGFRWLVDGIEQNKFKDYELCLMLDTFLRMMEHDIIRWTTIEKCLIEKITSMVNAKLEFSEEEKKILILSLLILESAIINCPGKFVHEIEKQLPLPKLCNLFKQDQHPEIQQNVLALINSIINRTDVNNRKALVGTLNSRQFKDIILQNIVNKNCSSDENKTICGSEIMHQLYVLQTLLLRVHEDKLSTGASLEYARDRVHEIRQFYSSSMERDSFEMKSANTLRSQNSLGSSSSSNNSFNSNTVADASYAEDFERLGFGNVSKPWEVFAEPPGALVLDLLHYFAKFHSDSFVRFVIENSSIGDRQYDCSLIVASFRLTLLISDMLGVGKAPRDEGKEFYPMLFDTDRPLEEFFSIGLSLFNRTWHEIHATSTDIDIVCDFLREKLSKTLANQMATHSLDSFRKELSKITYAEINRRWNEERQKRDRQKEEMPAIKELKRLLEPEMLDIVRQHRLNYLIQGTRFDKYTQKAQRVKDKFWYCRLSSNHKTLLFGDCEEDCKNLDEILVNKFNISDVHSLVTGKECPHMRDTKSKKSTISLAFALLSQEDSVRNLCFVAPKPEIFSYWVDGLNALLGNAMTSEEAVKDSETLLDLDVKLRLLDIEGLNIPDSMPELPPSPPNYNFTYKSSYVP